MKYKILIIAFCLMLMAGCSSRRDLADSSSQSEIQQESQTSSQPSAPETSRENEEPQSSSQPQQESSAEQQPPENQDDWRLKLVSAKYPLKAELDIELTQVGNVKVDSRMADSLKQMLADAKKEGYSLQVISGYRTFARSKNLYETKVQEYKNKGMGEQEALAAAAKWVAPPGTSEHHTGLAADIITTDYYTRLPELLPEFEEFEEAQWMKENAHKYGFILRFPKGKEDVTGINFEPWHFRFVGKENAEKIYKQGLTLEEFLGK